MQLTALLALLATAQAHTLDVNGDSVRIVRDGYGVPHISASTLKGLFHGAGYAVAQDRLWQMERNRRAALGDLAEIYGKSALEQDKSARLDGYTEEERLAQFARLRPDLKEAMSGYVDGVNAWIAENKWPAEFAQNGVAPRPWKVTDSIALAQMMARRFGAFGEGELRNLTAYTYLQTKLKDKALDAVNDIAWQNDPEAPTTIPAEEGGPKPPSPTPRAVTEAHLKLLPKFNLFELMAAGSMAAEEPQIAFAEAHGLYTRFGSYAVAVSSKKSSTGNALLLGAPQMGWSTPQIAHEIDLKGAGLDVMGMGFPGIPGVLIGFNPWLAWTTTSGLGDGADVFLESLDPADASHYMFNGKSLPLAGRTEVIRVKGADPVSYVVQRSAHGPVIKTVGGKYAFARKAAYWDREMESFEGFFEMARAKTLAEFETACRKVPTSHNFLAATQAGDIGYWFTGLYPVRSPKLDPRFPIPGTGEYEWTGLQDVASLPKCVNPKRGWMGNWNNKPAAWYPNSDTPVWGAVFRYKRIEDLFNRKSRIGPDDLRAMLPDIATYQLDADFFLPLLFQVTKSFLQADAQSGPEPMGAVYRQALDLLLDWDHKETEGSPPAAIFQLFMRTLRQETLLSTLGNFGSDSSFFQVAQASYLWHAYGKSPVKTTLGYFADRSREETLREAFQKTVDEMVKRVGPDLSAASYRAGRMSLAPLADVPYSNRGTYIQIIELGEPVRGMSILCPGQSEDPKSPHFSDQRDLASWWMFKPMKRPKNP